MRNNPSRLRGGDPRWADAGPLGTVVRTEFFGSSEAQPPSRQKMWDGTTWVVGVLKRWNGSQWTSGLKRFDGVSWVSV